jgi:hypothetical protein
MLWHWIAANKEWLFSGGGIAIISIGYWLFRKLFGSPSSQQPNTNSVIQAPFIKIELPQPSAPQPTLPAEPKSDPPKLQPKEELDLRPQLYSLEPRIIPVSENDDPEDGNGGIVEGGNVLRAVVAVFRMKKPSPDGNDTYLTARLSYRTKENIVIRDIEKEIHRVNYGTWLDEDYNFVKLRITDTKELVLVIQPEGSNDCLAVQDNRHSSAKYKGLAYYKLEPHDGSFYVDVTLVDGNYGPVVGNSYKIEAHPLKVHKIIRVPRA